MMVDKSISQIQFDRDVIESITDGSADIETDNEGQLIIYTNMYEWMDGSIRSEPDPDFG